MSPTTPPLPQPLPCTAACQSPCMFLPLLVYGRVHSANSNLVDFYPVIRHLVLLFFSSGAFRDTPETSAPGGTENTHNTHTHTHTPTTELQVCVYVCVCECTCVRLCVCVCMWTYLSLTPLPLQTVLNRKKKTAQLLPLRSRRAARSGMKDRPGKQTSPDGAAVQRSCSSFLSSSFVCTFFLYARSLAFSHTPQHSPRLRSLQILQVLNPEGRGKHKSSGGPVLAHLCEK
ncbi:hypothetical protein ACEWY4_017926 [Coilia grayii]|uniref:Uncharacterized protein n=1 Tax=Coilia grayii TaxID=363190 RepID=A0ABD1JI87_9TELE